MTKIICIKISPNVKCFFTPPFTRLTTPLNPLNFRHLLTVFFTDILMPAYLFLTFSFLLGFVASANAQGDPAEIPARYDLARMSLEDGEVHYAEQQFLKILNIDPKHAPTHLILGRLYHRQKHDANAYRHLKTYLDLSPEAPDKIAIHTLLNTLADSLKASGKGWVVTDPSKPWRPSVPPPTR